jgi:hypothetical protein
MRIMTIGAGCLDRGVNVSLIHYCHLLLMAVEANILWLRGQLMFKSRGVRIVANVAVADPYRPMNKFLTELITLMALETQIRRPALERKPVLRLVRIMATHTIAVGHRRMQAILEHHVATVFVTPKAEFLLVSC